MASAFVTLLVGAAVLLAFWLCKVYTFWWRRGVRTAKGVLPFIGHMSPLFTMKTSFADIVFKAYEENKDRSMVGLYKIAKPVLVVREPELIKNVLQSNFSSFHDNLSTVDPKLDPLVANNPFFNNGEKWVTGRKRLTYAFSTAKLKNLFMAVTGVRKKFRDYINRRLGSSDKYEVELKQLFSKFTGEVVANAGIGIEGLCFEDKPNPNAFDTIGNLLFYPSTINGIMFLLLLIFPDIFKLFRIRIVPKQVDSFFRNIVAESMEVRRKETTPRNDFLQLMIELETMEGKLDQDLIASHAFSFFLDGYETSSVTLSFVGYQLACHPDIQEKLRQEINDKIGRHGGELTFEALKEMTYMEQVIHESLRIYPALGAMAKVCTKETVLQGSDGISCRLQPGDEIVISITGVHNDAKYWDNPEIYDPDNFDEERKKSIEKMTFLPFGEGPRSCVGMRMAMLQMKSCLAELLRNYKLELSPKTQTPIKLDPTNLLSVPIGGLWVYVSKV